ncbi:hypothetical protein CPter91_0783 [Collimonas pratensis]|uniref:Uncharacterized protein n=1 Tax=Collimonas pratensis TaxID=279113 RepID=A0A127PZJ7_9BURK|nr:hypothetical protein CPter91_0783 [Collimonas pratensis]
MAKNHIFVGKFRGMFAIPRENNPCFRLWRICLNKLLNGTHGV